MAPSILLLLICLPMPIRAQPVDSLSLPEDAALSETLAELVDESGLGGSFDVGEDGVEQVSLVRIDMNGRAPVWGGVNPDD
ncbi:MAG TPA: hypothetical protein VFG50_12205 [Rhodothermales bacterium]|nr:hypothetical protein [Rhodothermales bacterium]